jgi:Ser/Thr protein kinase RdoA (MazF antagonist)
LHNDTKFNNVLLDAQGKGRCVIDLETVMPGYVPFDFGDGVRTTVSLSEEDEADLSQIQVEMDRFEAFASGYLSETASLLTPNEINYLPPAPALLAYLMGLRFLTDFLEGDRYYHIHFESHNLQRAKAQLTLAQRLRERLPELRSMTQSCLNR